MRLRDKVAIVTGGASGIGRAIAVGFAREGAAVVVADINMMGAAETVSQLEAFGGRGFAVETDVSSKEQTDNMVKVAMDHFGHVDILVTSAAVLEEVPVQDITVEQWDNIIDVTLNGVLYSAQSAIKVMKEQGCGKVVIISSIAAFRGRAGQQAYCAAEGSLTGLAANLAVQMGEYGICVNSIAPGIIDTDFAESLKDNPEYREFRRAHTPLRRIGKPEDIVGPAIFLASSDSDFITGETIVVDGGISIYTNGYGL
ncbi:MAG: SDR family oxidoreductase [Syntrophomonadaceae bacterium]|nr:SDR family oxidoreductase [Syntrophomonadaceae bacterium]